MKKVKIKFMTGIEREYVCDKFTYNGDKINIVTVNGHEQTFNSKFAYSVEVINDFELDVVAEDGLNCLRRYKTIDSGMLVHIVSLFMRDNKTILAPKLVIHGDGIYDQLYIIDSSNNLELISFKILSENNRLMVMSFEVASPVISDYFYQCLYRIKEEIDKNVYTFMF